MASWSDLRAELIRVSGMENVYYQPPSNVRMKFPCIRFKLEQVDVKYASNSVYMFKNKYQFTYISNVVSDDLIQTFVSSLRYCTFDRSYVSDNLYHYTFEIYY